MCIFQELSEQLKENGINPADFLDTFNDILKKNDVSITDMGKAALLQKAALAAGMDASAFSVLLDIQNGLIDAGFNEEQVAKVINDMVKNADFAGIGKSMMAVLDGHARLKVKMKKKQDWRCYFTPMLPALHVRLTYRITLKYANAK